MRTGKGAGETILGRTVGTGGRYECAFRRSNCFPSGRGAKEMVPVGCLARRRSPNPHRKSRWTLSFTNLSRCPTFQLLKREVLSVGLNKGEVKNTLARAVCFNRLGGNLGPHLRTSAPSCQRPQSSRGSYYLVEYNLSGTGSQRDARTGIPH